MRKHYSDNASTTAILQTNTYRDYPYAINTIWLDLPDGTANIMVREGGDQIAKWLWKLITDDLKKELSETL